MRVKIDSKLISPSNLNHVNIAVNLKIHHRVNWLVIVLVLHHVMQFRNFYLVFLRIAPCYTTLELIDFLEISVTYLTDIVSSRDPPDLKRLHICTCPQRDMLTCGTVLCAVIRAHSNRAVIIWLSIVVKSDLFFDFFKTWTHSTLSVAFRQLQ